MCYCMYTRMKSERVILHISPYRPYSESNPFYVIFDIVDLHGVYISPWVENEKKVQPLGLPT